MLGRWGDCGICSLLFGDRSFDFVGLEGGVTAPPTGGDLDGDFNLGGELQSH